MTRNNQIREELENMSNQAIIDSVKLDEAKRLTDLQQTLRLSQNAIQLLLEGRFPGTHCKVVQESIEWLQAIARNVETQLPKKEGKTEESK